jgi:23S rRNA pseudouridine1911/1915/1917 synthase
LIAKTDRAHQQLSAQLSHRELTRIYSAIAHGRFNTLSGIIDAPIGRHPGDRKKMAVVAEYGREAVTIYHVMEQYAEYTLLQLQLKTGRTHQIRVHLKHIQHPVVGDPVYGHPTKNNLNMTRQALHAAEIKFTHPVTGELMTFAAPLPADIQTVLNRLRTQNH